MSGELGKHDEASTATVLRRLPKPLEKRYPVVRLYLDDLQEIMSLIRQHFRRVRLQAEGYPIKNVDELKGLANKQIHAFEVEAFAEDVFLRVTLDRQHASVYLSRDDDTLFSGVFARLDAILRRRASILRFLNQRPAFWAMMAIAFLLLGIDTGPAWTELGQDLRGFILNQPLPTYSLRRVPFVIFQLPFVAMLYTYVTQFGRLPVSDEWAGGVNIPILRSPSHALQYIPIVAAHIVAPPHCSCSVGRMSSSLIATWRGRVTM